MQDRPTALEILATIGEYLQDDVLPIVDGGLRYKTLVAANLLALLQRELEVGDGPQQREVADLTALLEAPGSPPQGADVAALYQRLQTRLLSAEPLEPSFLRQARDVLERGVLDKMAVNKPGYDRYDQAVEIPAAEAGVTVSGVLQEQG